MPTDGVSMYSTPPPAPTNVNMPLPKPCFHSFCTSSPTPAVTYGVNLSLGIHRYRIPRPNLPCTRENPPRAALPPTDASIRPNSRPVTRPVAPSEPTGRINGSRQLPRYRCLPLWL